MPLWLRSKVLTKIKRRPPGRLFFVPYVIIFGLQFCGVEEDGDRTIVDEIDFHVCAETAGLDL